MPFNPFLLLLFSLQAFSQYVSIPFNSSHSVGPDGPWMPLTMPVGAPLQLIDTYPTINSTINWFVSTENCAQPNQSCLNGQPSYYNVRTFSGTRDFNFTQNTTSVPFDQLYGDSNEAMDNLEGFGFWHAESITLPPQVFLGSISQVTSNNTNIVYPGGASYVPLSTISLNPTGLALPTKENGSMVWSNLISGLETANKISSLSWTMHMGSFAQNINGSLVIGGYDQSHLIEHPGNFTGNMMQLTSVTLGTSSGASPWTSNQQGQNFLGNGSGNTNSINTSFEPSLSYLFLPSSVCTALAGVLPISFNSDFNLYTWNVDDQLFKDIVTSPSYLNFTFSDQLKHTVSIRVAFALLNLTLEAPLVSKPTQYFPCYPSSTSSDIYILGRAFLQAALIGQNTNSGRFWLAQAPGPITSSSGLSIKELSASDTQLDLPPAPPSWEQTWSDILKPLASSPATNTLSDGNISTASSSLSGGAIAGTIIGVLALAAIACATAYFLLRARKRRSQENVVRLEDRYQALGPTEKKMPAYGPTQSRLVEAPSHEPSETPGWSPSEVAGDEYYDLRQGAGYSYGVPERGHLRGYSEAPHTHVPRAEMDG